MSFNSLEFFIFFPVVVALYFLLPHKYRWLLLLAASAIFYAAFIPVYLLVLLALVLAYYFSALFIEKAVGRAKRIYLTAGIFVPLLVLFIFKYLGFFNINLAKLADFLGWNYSLGTLSLILPLGISFFTFQGLSYVIEVYRGRQKAERHLGIVAVYIMFFPQLVAGPIERPQNLMRQFYEKHTFDYKQVTDGLKLILWGLFKKVVIADRMAFFVNQVYGSPTEYQGVSLILATVFFGFQIYGDFSGYSDIARGSAQVMGFRLMKNFNIPYFAKSVGEFWQRWHISLSTWLRDYVYIPLGGNRVSQARWHANILTVFVISGLWHGANWTFILWGALHGLYLVAEHATQGIREKLKIPSYIQVLMTFSFVTFAWIFFRADSLGDAFYIVNNLFAGVGSFVVTAFQNLIRLNFGQGIFGPILLGQPPITFIIAVASLAVLAVVYVFESRGNAQERLAAKPVWVRWAVYYFLVIALLLFGVFDSTQQFIYFQF